MARLSRARVPAGYPLLEPKAAVDRERPAGEEIVLDDEHGRPRNLDRLTSEKKKTIREHAEALKS